MKLLAFIASTLLASNITFGQTLTNTSNLDITKNWAQQPTGYTYQTGLLIPAGPVPPGGFPVCVMLHGNGGNGPAMVQQFKNLIQCHILVAPSGYMGSWDIVDEDSEGPDLFVINELIDTLQKFTNVNANQIRILGFSNGAALTNRVFIENKNQGIDKFCAVVSQLSQEQYRNGLFYRPSGPTSSDSTNNGYNTPVIPLLGRNYLSICNTNDNIIPYTGGSSVVAANFLDAQEATFRVAQSQGYTGAQLSSAGDSIAPDLYKYSYLEGSVVHLKGNASHGLNPDQEAYIASFFNDCSTPTNVSVVSNKNGINIYPNPSSSTIVVSGSFDRETSYQIIAISGQVVKEGVLKNSKQEIDISSLSPNWYYLKIGSKTTKFFKSM